MKIICYWLFSGGVSLIDFVFNKQMSEIIITQNEWILIIIFVTTKKFIKFVLSFKKQFKDGKEEDCSVLRFVKFSFVRSEQKVSDFLYVL